MGAGAKADQLDLAVVVDVVVELLGVLKATRVDQLVVQVVALANKADHQEVLVAVEADVEEAEVAVEEVAVAALLRGNDGPGVLGRGNQE